MDLSIFLARFLGLYMIIITLLLFIRNEDMKPMINDLIRDRCYMALSGVISLIIGVAIVASHNIWEPNWKGLITLFGYLGILKGIMRLGFYEQTVTFVEKMMADKNYWITTTIIFLFGLFLTYIKSCIFL